MKHFSLILLLHLIFPVTFLGASSVLVRTAEKVAVQSVQQAVNDTTDVKVRRPGSDALDTFRANPDFAYFEREVAEVSLWDQLLEWIFDQLSVLWPDDEEGVIQRRVLYVIAFIVLGLAFLGLIKMDPGGVFSGKKQRSTGLINIDEDDFQETDFLKLAEEARNAEDLRIATRMYYMHVLKVLDQKEAIVWKPRKTNQDYLVECRLPDFQAAFARLTYLFDYSWYGDFPVSKAIVEEMRSLTLAVEKGTEPAA